MKLFLIIISSLFLLMPYSWGQKTLVGNQNGQWTILSGAGNKLLPRSIHEVGNFDSEGLTYFAESNLYGILNSAGEVVFPPSFRSIRQLGGGVYQCLNLGKHEIIDFSTEQKKGAICLRTLRYEKNWVLIELEERKYLFNSKSKKEIEMSSRDLILDNMYNYIYVSFDNGSRVLFDPLGDSVSLAGISPSFHNDCIVLMANSSKEVIFSNRKITLPNTTTKIEIHGPEIYYSYEGKTEILDSENGEKLLSVNYDWIERLASGKYRSFKGAKKGIIKNDSTIICPPKYNHILENGSYYLVYSSSGVGIVDLNGKEALPSIYSYIKPTADYFLVTSKVGLQGLVSKKTNQIILDCLYSKIKFGPKKIRAWSGSKMRILELDENHKVINSLLLSNTITVQKKYSILGDEKLDGRLFSKGWFTEITPKFNDEGFKIGEIRRWGLKNESDSIILNARYQQPIYVAGANLDLIPRSKVNYEYLGNQNWSYKAYTLINVSTGKPLMRDYIFSMDTSDFLERNFIRFSSLKGFGIVRSNNSVEYVDYFDGEDVKNIRFCKLKEEDSGILAAKELDPERVSYSNLNLNDDPSIKYPVVIDKHSFENIKFNNAEWNFFDQDGMPLFEESFEFTYPFYRERAIAKRNGKWGVVDNDSTIIPFIYQSVKRELDLSDTIFIVGKTCKGTRVLDSLSLEIDQKFDRVLQAGDGFFQVQKGNAKVILDTKFEVLSANSRAQKILNDQLFYYREKKEYHLTSKNGENVAVTSHRPIEVFHDKFILVKSGSNFGLVNFQGDTIIPFKYKSIQDCGKFIFAKNGLNNLLFDSNGELIKKLKVGNVIVDEVNDEFAILHRNYCTIYNSMGEKMNRYSNFQPDYFHGGLLIQTGKNSKVLHSSGKEIETDISVKNVMCLNEFGFLIEHTNRSFSYLNLDWESHSEITSFTGGKYLGEGVVYGRVNGNSVLISVNDETHLSKYARPVGEFDSGLILIKDRFDCFYLNEKFENPFARKYREAMPFKDGYASVFEVNGWTIITSRGFQQTLPSYSKITPWRNNIFVTANQKVYGLLDSHGSEIIPVAFTAINILNDGLIQCVKNGELFYFDSKGHALNF